MLTAFAAEGWLAEAPGCPRGEALHSWALVEQPDGSIQMEGIVWDAEWADEPGAAEFPQAASFRPASVLA